MSQLYQQLQSYAYNTVILDTETTGLDDGAEIIEIAVIDTQGYVLLNTLVKPSRPFNDFNEAAQIHGIRYAELENAPSWPQVQERLLEIIRDKTILIYNAAFDTRLMNQSARAHGGGSIEYPAVCLMQLYSKWFARQYGGSIRRHRQVEAAAHCGVDTGRAHRALDDCRTALGIWRYMRANCAATADYQERTQRAKTTANPNGHLYGETVVITGDLSRPRAEIQQMAADAGCRCTASVSPKTTILLLGETDLTATRGQAMSSKERKARELQAQGSPIRILNEQEFMALLNQS